MVQDKLVNLAIKSLPRLVTFFLDILCRLTSFFTTYKALLANLFTEVCFYTGVTTGVTGET